MAQRKNNLVEINPEEFLKEFERRINEEFEKSYLAEENQQVKEENLIL